MEGCPLKGLYGDIRPRAVKTEKPKENEMETAAAWGFGVKGLGCSWEWTIGKDNRNHHILGD